MLKCICRLHGTGTIRGRNVRRNLLNRKIFYSLNCKGMSDTYNKDTKLNFSFPHWCEVLMQQHKNGEYNIIMGTTLCFNNWFHLRGQHMHTHTHTQIREKRKLKLKCVLGLYMVLVHVFSLILDSNMEVLIIWFHPTGKIRLVKNAEGLSSISLDNLCKYFCFT